LTGGYLPLSVVLTRDTVYRAFYDDAVTRGFLHSHSYTGNALACRAALATLAIFDEDDVITVNRGKAARLTSTAAPLSAHPRVRHFRNTGMIWAFEVDTTDDSFARNFHARALEKELLLRPLGNTVYFMPPYVIGDDEIALLVKRTTELLDALH
jgi:adenosylmethionine-8-amino-7-oxononanoate aminotransferase